ncbi:unnamed protein product [Lepeophtheirus salmonis]|uniref:(salmon louse) hypothetical protein n=1 Tax=Lepeophtheirus salmonis TaxID=72036 RepID=A0A7R8H6L7_LEPSM|nr:unnamed protein product [Lepeophtheirus salmonis]CAF2885950.1 unnamed protein product [Lepeophtheirus salmonis]
MFEIREFLHRRSTEIRTFPRSLSLPSLSFLFPCENCRIVSENEKISAELTKYKQIANASDNEVNSLVVDNPYQMFDSTSSEVNDLLKELNKTKQLYEDQEKVVEQKKNRLDKNLNDEIETLRRLNKVLTESRNQLEYDGEVEDLLRDEIESLKQDVIQANIYHSMELDKIRKANEKVINEYKDANKELQKQVGICSNRDKADDSIQLVHQQMNKSDQSFKIDSSI